MRRKKLLKIAGISIGLLVALVLLFVVAFIFNPFEGSLRDMRELVPRNVDFFVRKTDMKGEFNDFPAPNFWNDLEASPAWRTLGSGGWVRDARRDGVDDAVNGLRQAASQIANDSMGTASLMGDILGREVILAGQLGSNNDDRWCAFLRISWKIKFAWGLLEWDSVRSGLAVTINLREDGVMVIDQPDGTQVFVARHLDCIIATNDEGLLANSLQLADGNIEVESFGSSSDYRDGIEQRVQAWRDQTGVTNVSPYEMYLRPDQLFEIADWDDGWPDPRHPDDMTERVLASFLNLESWRFLTNSMLFENIDGVGNLTMLGRVDMNRNKHSGFQTQFFRAEPSARQKWLDPFLGLVPDTACAAAALRMPAGDFLMEMWQALDADLRSSIDEMVLSTGEYDSVGDLIAKLREALQQRIGFVFHRTRKIGDGIESFEPSPAPHVAWVFWVDPRFKQVVQAFYDFMHKFRGHLKLDKAFNLPVTGGAAREYVNPNIPVTGEIAVLVWRDFFVISNSGPLVQDMIERAHIGGRNLLTSTKYGSFREELDERVNGFVFADGERLSEVADDYLAFLQEDTQQADEGWMLDVRPQIERDVLRSQFSSYRSVASIPEGELDRFEDAVRAAMQSRWLEVRNDYVRADRSKYLQMKALFRCLDAGYMQIRMDPQWLEWKSRFTVEFR